MSGHERRRIVIVGAGLAGLRAAEALRKEGFSGPLTVIGDEAYAPYDRPPLSKHVLTGRIPVEKLSLPRAGGLDITWRLGVSAARLDMDARAVELADGGRVEFDSLLIATGAKARPWPRPEESRLSGVFTLRTRDDARAFRAALAGRPRRVLIVGGGFIGSEAASSCRELGLPVTVVHSAPAPMAGVVGGVVGGMLARVMRTAGVDLRLGVKVSALEGSEGRVRRARLSNGGSVDADVVLAAMGAVRGVEWLEGSGIAADPAGIQCDAFCRALDASGKPVEGVCAAGDAAAWPHPLYGGRMVTLEHWGNAVEQAAAAARTLLSPPGAAPAYNWLPAFWSSQFGLNIKGLGLADGADGMVIAHGSPRENRFLAVFGRNGRTVAALSVNSGRWLPAYADPISRGAPFPCTRRGVDEAVGAEARPRRLA